MTEVVVNLLREQIEDRETARVPLVASLAQLDEELDALRKALGIFEVEIEAEGELGVVSQPHAGSHTPRAGKRKRNVADGGYRGIVADPPAYLEPFYVFVTMHLEGGKMSQDQLTRRLISSGSEFGLPTYKVFSSAASNVGRALAVMQDRGQVRWTGEKYAVKGTKHGRKTSLVWELTNMPETPS